MPAPTGDLFVLLATAADSSIADVCASLLRSAGIESRLRGESLGPYRLTIGEMAATQVWVPRSRLEDARALVFAGEVPGLEPPRSGRVETAADAPAAPWTPLLAVVGALLVAVALWLVLTRLF